MAAAPKPPRVRVLLLARSDGDWWDALLERELALKALLTAQEPIELRPLAMEAVERQAVFEEALVAFANHRKQPVPRAQISAGDPRFDRVLYLHMAALAAVERNAEPAGAADSAESAVVLDAGELMDQTLDHEQRFWLRDRQGRNRAVLSMAQQIMAAATLRGGIEHETEAQELCKRLSGRERTDADDELLTLLHDVYALNDGTPYLPGLQPDLLGEAMVLRVASKQADDKWIERVIVESDNATAVGSAFTVLGRAAAVNTPAMSPWLARLLRTELATRALPALRAAKAVGQRTAFSPLGNLLADALELDGSVSIAHVLEKQFPSPTFSLRRVAVWSTQTRLALAPVADDERSLSTRAALLHEHGRRLESLGQRGPGLTAICEAVDLYRALVARNPDAFEPKLAMSLNNLGAMLTEIGQLEKALAITREAVELYRALAARDAVAFQPDLAMSLNNLGNKCSALCQYESALTAAHEAVDLYRVLAAQKTDAYNPALASSLSNLSNRLSDSGQREPALTAAREAVDLHRVLAARNPDAFQPDLALSLSNLGNSLSDLGQYELALDVTRETVKLYRALASRSPDTFQPYLAMSLNNLGNYLSDLGQREAARPPTYEAMEIYRTLAARIPDKFQPYFAKSLNNWGVRLNALGKHESALAAIREVVDIYRVLAVRNPNTFQSDLADGLNNLGIVLGTLRQYEPGITAAQEAVKIYRALAVHQPDAFLPYLAPSLKNLGIHLRMVGQHEAAIDAIREAVEICRALAAKHPVRFLPDLARSLKNLARQLTGIGDPDAADVASREVAEIHRTLQAKTFDPDDEGDSA
jgi:tetratricopeptide (TPR) repeat protein